MRITNIISTTLVSKLAYNYAQAFGLAYCNYNFETHKVSFSAPRLVYSVTLNLTTIVLMPILALHLRNNNYNALNYPEDLVVLVYILNSFVKYASVLVTFVSHWLNAVRYCQIKANIDHLETSFLDDKSLTSLEDLGQIDEDFVIDITIKFIVFVLTFVFTYLTIFVVEDEPTWTFHLCWLYTVILYKFLSISINFFYYETVSCYKLFKILKCQLRVIEERIPVSPEILINEKLRRITENYCKLLTLAQSLSESYRWPLLAICLSSYINSIVFIYFCYRIVNERELLVVPLVINICNMLLGFLDAYFTVRMGTKFFEMHKECQWKLSTIEVRVRQRCLWKSVGVL